MVSPALPELIEGTIMRKILLKSGVVAMGGIAVCQVVSFTIRYAAGQPFTAFVFGMNILVPLLTAFPAAIVVFSQSERLARAHTQLGEAHALLAVKSSLAGC
jgi:hypothetical protein